VLASDSETFGVVFIEALACGVPAAGTACGGPEDIIHEGNGILVPVGDVHALAEAMITIADNRDRYDSAELSREAVSKYSPHEVARRILEVYEQCGRNIK
jgi:glycosyltransferase involved in cell wall biosynthesis